MSIVLRRLPIEVKHGSCEFYAMGRGGAFPLLDTIRKWGAQRPKELAKLAALLNFFARTGNVRNVEKVRNLGRQIFEFKTTDLRVFWFWDEGRIVVCTHGLKKQSQKTPRREIDRAVAWREDYFEAKAEGSITIKEGS